MTPSQWDAQHTGWNFDVREGPVRTHWFKGGTTNLAVNCLDRNVERGLGDQAALIWEGNEPSAGQGSGLRCRATGL